MTPNFNLPPGHGTMRDINGEPAMCRWCDSPLASDEFEECNDCTTDREDGDLDRATKKSKCELRPGIGLCDGCVLPKWPQEYCGLGMMLCLDCLNEFQSDSVSNAAGCQCAGIQAGTPKASRKAKAAGLNEPLSQSPTARTETQSPLRSTRLPVRDKRMSAETSVKK